MSLGYFEVMRKLSFYMVTNNVTGYYLSQWIVGNYDWLKDWNVIRNRNI